MLPHFQPFEQCLLPQLFQFLTKHELPLCKLSHPALPWRPELLLENGLHRPDRPEVHDLFTQVHTFELETLVQLHIEISVRRENIPDLLLLGEFLYVSQDELDERLA